MTAFAFVFAMLGASWPSDADAAPLEVIKLNRSGPESAPPLGEPFYLQLNKEFAESVDRFEAVFVRYWSRPFGAQPLRPRKKNTLRSCHAIKDLVGDWKLAPKLAPGVHKVDKVWVDASGNAPPADKLARLHREQRVLLTNHWKKGSGSDKEPRILVDDKKFFTSGARYCLIVYTHQPSKTKDETLSLAIDGYAKAFASTIAGGQATPQSINDAAKSFLSGRLCRKPNNGQQGPVGAADCAATGETRTPIASQDWDKLYNYYAAQGFDAIKTLVYARQEFENLSSCWPGLPNNQPSVAWPLPPLPVTKTPNTVEAMLGTLAAELATRSGALARNVGPAGRGTPPLYLTIDGKLSVDRIELIEDPTSHRLVALRAYASDGKAAGISANPTKLTLPGSVATLEDIALFVRGRMVYGGKIQKISDVFKGLGATTWQRDPPELRAEFDRLAAVLQSLETVAGASVASNDVPALLAALGQKFGGRTVNQARDVVADVCNAGTIPAGAALPNSTTLRKYLETRSLEYRAARKNWATLRAKGTITVHVEQQATDVPLPEAGYTQERFIHDYVTPIQGFAAIFPNAPGEDPFFMPYAGIQVYFAPNPVNRPMWSRGYRDLARLFSVELGLAETRQNLGPQERFRGPGGGKFLPFLLGGGAQLVPWLSVSAGAVFMERRRSIFDGETYELGARFYIAGTVQANIPGLIKRLSGDGRDTKSTD